jgi:hypothetical protein
VRRGSRLTSRLGDSPRSASFDLDPAERADSGNFEPVFAQFASSWIEERNATTAAFRRSQTERMCGGKI